MDWHALSKDKTEAPDLIVSRVYIDLQAMAALEGGIDWPYAVPLPKGYDIGGRGDYAALKRAFEDAGLVVEEPTGPSALLGRGFTIRPKPRDER
ncbi:MAG: hypothetical protein H6705_16835 [Myxococcales bacterium]|nr:hypothetical protein [Myxococcales bacterium]